MESLIPMPSQENPDEYQEDGGDDDSGALNRYTLLQLPLRPLAATSAAGDGVPEAGEKLLKECMSCGSVKKRSPSFNSSFQEPSSKRAAIAASTTTTPNASPPTSGERNRDPIRRSHSDIACSPGSCQVVLHPGASNGLTRLSSSPMQEMSKNTCPLPPGSQNSPVVPHPLYKSLSYPAENRTPPRSHGIFPPRVPDEGSPNSKKLKKLKEKVEEMRQWMRKVAREDEEEEDTTCSPNNDVIHYNGKEKAESEPEESVWVKETEEGLILHFKCPCSNGYEIFLHGDKCFYRLT